MMQGYFIIYMVVVLEIVDMCLAKNESSHFYQPVYLTASDPNCTCSLTGSVTRVKILQTIFIKLLIQSKDNNIFELQYTGVNLYGDDIPVQADNLIIAIRNGSDASLTLIKVLGGFTISCDKNIPVRASSSLINRRAFKIEPTIGTSFTKSKTSIFIESTTNDQVPVYKEKIESPKMATTDGGVLSWIQTILIIFLLLFAFLIYYKKRTEGHSSVEIGIKDKQEKLMLVCHPKNEKKTSIEIHQADCMCASNNKRNETASAYTPLQIENEVERNFHTSTSNDYLDVI